MKDKITQDVQKTDCCAEGQCCSSPSTNEKQQNTDKRQRWKIAVLVLVIVLIVAATSYSLISKANASSSSLLNKGNVPSIGTNTSQNIPAVPVVLNLSNVPSIGANTSQNIPAALGGLKWTEGLTAKFADHDFIFVILPDSAINSSETLSKLVSDASATIEAKGARVETLVLSASDPEFSLTVKRLVIGSLPAVVAISSAGNKVVIAGEITEVMLLQTYLTVTQPPAASCAPGSGCCGGK